MSTAEDTPARPACTSELDALRRENRELREALGTRPVIEQAKGALMWRFRISDEAAFAVLRRWSQDSNVKLHTVADVLVNVVGRPGANGARTSALASWLVAQVGEQPGQQPGQHSGDSPDQRTDGRAGERAGRPRPVPARWAAALDARA